MSFEKEPKRYLIGDGAGGNVYVYGDSHEDAGTAIVARFQPNHIAPAGVGGECIFPAVYIAVTYATAATINLTPILDGERLPNASKELVLNAQEETLDRFEVYFSRAHKDDAGNELSRYAIRGTWFGVEITVQDLFGRNPGSLIVHGVEAEYEVVRESAEDGWKGVAGPVSLVWDDTYDGWVSRPPGGQSEASISINSNGYVEADPAGQTAELFRNSKYDWARF